MQESLFFPYRVTGFDPSRQLTTIWDEARQRVNCQYDRVAMRCRIGTEKEIDG